MCFRDNIYQWSVLWVFQVVLKQGQSQITRSITKERINHNGYLSNGLLPEILASEEEALK